MRFVAANDMQALLGVSQGSVTPLAVLNDTAGQVKVILSQPAADAAILLLHPLSNEATIKMTPAQLQKFVKEAGNEIEVIDMDKEPEAASGKKAKQPNAKGRPRNTPSFVRSVSLRDPFSVQQRWWSRATLFRLVLMYQRRRRRLDNGTNKSSAAAR